MFTAAANTRSQNGTPASTTRGRRRQRPLSSDNSLNQPKAKRLRPERPTVTDQTFVSPDAAPETYEVKSTKSSAVPIKQDGIEIPLAPKQELSVRSKKSRTGDRYSKGDGSTLLSTTAAFDVRRLPALPDRLKLEETSRQHGSLDTTTGYALSLTHTHAIVWLYANTSPSPESFTFTLPYPSKYSTDALPLGTLVSPAASSSEPGLVVVMPNSGKVTYWESISSATTLDFMKQQRNGVEDSIPGIHSGETATQIVNAESAAGFVLSFSSGRLAYLSVRDAHGRPKISAQWLRTSHSPATSGIFGSIRNAFSTSALQGEIAAVRSDRSSKQGECTVVACTSRGRLHSWKVHRGGHHDVLTEVDMRDTIFRALQEASPTNDELPSETLKILDFCFVPKGMSSKYTEMSQLRAIPAAEDTQHILALVSLMRSKAVTSYVLVEIMVPNGASSESPIDIGMVRPISAFSSPFDARALAKPRLYLPKPAVIAFLVFDHAAVIVSVARPPPSPESQFLEDNHIPPATFEDVVDLRQDPTFEIIGSGVEEPYIPGRKVDEMRPSRIKTKNPAAVILVRGAGTLRLTVTDVEKFAGDEPPKLTAKAKLEQAVFFGVKEDNPLVFDVQHGSRFSDEEFTEAALGISHEILTSTARHLPSNAVHIDHNIKARVRYLSKIMTQIQSIKVKLSRTAKWQLLWDAERMHVASIVWHKHEEYLQQREKGIKNSIVAEAIEYLRAEESSQKDKEGVDYLREFFTRDIYRMELFLGWLYETIKYSSKANMGHLPLSHLIYEALDVYNSAIRAVTAFRSSHLELYGLGQEDMKHGILSINGYAGLPIPWTCTKSIPSYIKRSAELATEWVKKHWASRKDPENRMIQKTRDLLPEITEVYLTVLQEYARSCLAADDPQTHAQGVELDKLYEKDRHERVVMLAETENWDSAVKIAEHHRSLAALAEILTRQVDKLKDQLGMDGSPQQLARIETKMADLEEKVREYFGIYKQDFANPFYEYLFSTFGVDALLNYQGDKKYKTMYLRTKPELAKISWINDIIGEEDVDHAADTLLDLGLAREQHVWNKKIELSLGKLARMAETSRPSSKASMSVQDANINGTAEDAQVDAIDRELTIIGIQNEFYNTQIQPIISVGIDESADLALVQEAFPLKYPKKYKILTQIFEDGLHRLLKHEALDPLTLIDLLTLASLPHETREHIPDQFWLAIQVAHNGLSGAERVQAERLIWRRCYLREDWTKLNNTVMKDDNAIIEHLGRTDLFQIFCTLYAFQRKGDDQTSYRRLMPSEVAGVYCETLDRRFEKMEKSYREKVLEAMRWEDANLRKHIEKHRLDQWAKEARKHAENAVASRIDASTAAKSPSGPSTRYSKTSQAANGQNGTD
ncbi:Nup133 N terminal like-domain-containing protein [Xylariaceae sp. FL0016]|nr:Nup133 N terminal like-domain-containing protein [Xylariaceae sp. FL0016]